MVKICAKCGKTIPATIVVEGKRRNLSNRKYCMTCSPWGKHNTVQLHIPEPKEKLPRGPIRYCKNCQKVLVKRQQRHYCSLQCSIEKRMTTYIEEWLAGNNNGMQTKNVKLSMAIRSWLLDKRGTCCEICGWNQINPTTGKVPIEIHHIDGDSHNNKPDNLQLLCPNCHSLTPTYRALNKGKGKRGRQGR